jgi:hypothetical protein
MQRFKWVLTSAFVAAVLVSFTHQTGMRLTLGPKTVHAAPPPVIAIASCNPTFVANVAGGSYMVTANLVPAAGQSCILVAAPGVIVNLNGHTLTGTGAGVGIVIEPGMSGADVFGGVVTGFTTGILDDGNSALLETLTVVNNVGNGVVMNGVDGSILDTSVVISNGANGVYLLNTKDCIVKYNQQIAKNGTSGQGYGVWIQNTSTTTTLSFDNIVAANVFGAGAPQHAGIWVGFSPNAPLACVSAAKPSSGNILVANQNITSNTVVGIGLECATATSNTVTDNHPVAGNPAFDLFDGTAACDANSWVADVFGTKNQACVN